MNLSRFTFVRLLCCSCAVVLLTAGAAFKADDATNAEKKSVRRLPAHFGQVVDSEQREKIYALQEKYEPRITELEQKLNSMRGELRSECRAILTKEQQKKLDTIEAAAKEKRENRKKTS